MSSENIAEKAVYKPCAIIPVYNHSLVLRETVAGLIAHQLPVILVDDGSDQHCKKVMASIAEEFPLAHLVCRPQNGGKGAALKDGLSAALNQGFSHAIQVDADGQHDISDLQHFMAISQQQTKALVCGFPQYDESVPRVRYYGRYASHIWVWINSLSFEIKDSMCGFRVYPVAASCNIIAQERLGNRMDFDGEFIVRWHWRGHPLEQIPTKVIYPENGVSHFRLWRDNGLISWMHTRLFFGMLLRSPKLLSRNLFQKRTKTNSDANNHSAQKQKTTGLSDS